MNGKHCLCWRGNGKSHARRNNKQEIIDITVLVSDRFSTRHVEAPTKGASSLLSLKGKWEKGAQHGKDPFVSGEQK